MNIFIESADLNIFTTVSSPGKMDIHLVMIISLLNASVLVRSVTVVAGLPLTETVQLQLKLIL